MGEKNWTPKSFSRELRNFFTLCVLTDRTPRGGKSQNNGVLGPFGLGQPLGTEKFRAKNRKTQFPRARGTFGRKLRPPQKFLPKSAQLFYTLRFDRPDPQGREIAKYCVFRPFWPRAAPWYLEKSGPKTEKRDFPELGALLAFRKKTCPPQKILPKSAQLV